MRDSANLALWSGTPTRRRLIAGIATFGGLGTVSAIWADGGDDEVSHTAESIHQEPVFKADRKRVYNALTDAKQFDQIVQLSGALASGSLGNQPTEISPAMGGSFTLFGGHIVGRHIELVRNERIVQAWRVVDWNPGAYSIVRFELIEQGGSTKVIFDHAGFPSGLGQHLAEGWKAHYWQPLKKYLA